jgi:hypothetical protein
MIVFEYSHSIEPGILIRVVIDEDSNIEQTCEGFERFLRAAGYAFNGTIEYMEKRNVTN